MLASYFPILIMLIMAAGFGVTMLFVSSIAGKKKPTQMKESPYECGSIPVGSARIRFDVKFYIVAILFILFDLEVVFLWPWAVLLADKLKMAGFISIAVFTGILLVGYIYAWKKGALEWE